MKPSGLIGIDTGGTFTDVVYQLEDGTIHIFKVASTPTDPSHAVIEGLEQVGAAVPRLVHGSTVATNALLERAGAVCALVTTRGFEDLLAIGRQTRTNIYDLNVDKPEQLVAPEASFGISERIGAGGDVIVAVSPADAADLARRIREAGFDSVAICLLHAYANPGHERVVAAAMRDAGIPYVCASHEILPEFREFERCSTTTVNAYVGPVMDAYLANLETAVGADVRIMQSNGGALSLAIARQRAVETVLSGPAGGVVGAQTIAAAAGFDNIVTFDMGGTSTDVSLCAGSPSRTSDAELEGIPIRVPMLDIHTVGAGGGSIGWRDPAGGLRVGPRSAGADPGPACYGRGGTSATVTDANLYLGRLSPDHFLGGSSKLDVRAAEQAIEGLSAELDGDPREVAAGIVTIANSTMEGAIRVISVERGHDPADFTLVCFGGAGGLHAVELADALRMPRVLVPPDPGTLSAYGMLLADVVRDYSRTHLGIMGALDDSAVEAAYRDLEGAALGEFEPAVPELERTADLRYRGQGFELRVSWDDRAVESFHALHEERYGYADRGREVELVTLRVRATESAGVGLPPAAAPAPSPPSPQQAASTNTFFDGSAHETGIYDRGELVPGQSISGPAIVAEYSSTTVLPPGWTAHVDAWRNLVLERV